MIRSLACISAALSICACTSAAPDSAAEDVAGDVSEVTVAPLQSRIEDLEQRLDEVEQVSKEARDSADEAHELAESASRKAEEACEPYGYQPGCGNDR